MNNSTKWIWKNGENRENTWLCFVKQIYLDNPPREAVAKIAVDSKYWLYVNGVQVVFEGGLKRGPSKKGTYYDEVCIGSYLRHGSNKIAMLVWHFGKSGFSHLSSGMGGLLFEADMGEIMVLSDASWKVMKHPAYVRADEFDIPANFRLPESNVYFDAAQDIGEWYAVNYDTSFWGNADIICGAEEGAYGTLEKRIIPQFKNYGLKNYVNSGDVEKSVTSEEMTFQMKLPYNAQITPYLKITAEEGKQISIKSDTYDQLSRETKSIMSVYYTKGGIQEYEFPNWINGESICYTIPAGVTIHKLQYRETGYDTEFTGSFECDNEFLNILWQKSLRTLYLTMRDTFMDCPDRERVQWWGDVNVEMQMMMYCLDKNALLLYEKGIDSMAAWAREAGRMLTVVPSGTEQFELPFQNLAGIWGFSYYYDYTGNRDIIEKVYSMSKEYVLGYVMNREGLVEHKSGSWDWADWGENADIAPMENAWYYMALESCAKMAELLGVSEDTDLYGERMESIKINFKRLFLKNGICYSSTKNQKPDDRANALAVLAGLAEMSDNMLEVLKTSDNSSPYMEKYVLDALCETGHIDEAVTRMKRRYKEMVEFDYSTLWEYWSKEGTLNHAWSGGPLITMSKYIAGIKPLDTAYERFEIKPHTGGLNSIRCVVPSIKGEIMLDVRKTDYSVSMNVKIPQNTTAEVYLPLVNGAPPLKSDYKFTLSGGYAKFVLTSGTYHL